ncbi:MAG TPA: IPT/TIG domain-containing protein [Solirubrobacterales bacterium]
MKLRKREISRVGLLAAAMASVWILVAAAATAQATTITVGSVFSTKAVKKPFENVVTLLNTALPEKGATLTSPVNGTIIRWHIQNAVGGPFFLRVLRPSGSGSYMAAGTSAASMPTSEGVQTFTTSLPVKAGDTIGVDPSHASDEIGFVESSGGAFASIFPPPLEGATVASSNPKSGEEVQLSAEVQPQPTVTSVEPRAGSIAGGETVILTGTYFGEATAVKFGELPASSFKVESETKIKAVAPASKIPGSVDVTVTTPGGTSEASSADHFVYKACVVPKLKKKKLNAAKNALRSAGCTLGKVSGLKGKEKKNKEARVVSQKPQPGRILVPGAKVNVKLALKRSGK